MLLKNEVVIYIRTSTKEQNPENQLADCLSINHYGEYELIEDKQSAWKDDKEREGFAKIQNLITKKQIKHLICWDLDRLFRNRLKLIAFFTTCKMYDVKIHSFRQQWLEDLNNIPPPFNEMMFNLMLQIMGWLAEEESNKRSARIKNSVRRIDGITKSYKGNKWGRKNKPIHIDYILELHSQGKSTYEIARLYSENPKFKAKISHQTVHNILKKATKTSQTSRIT